MQATDKPIPMTDINDIKPLENLVVDWSLLFYILGAVLILAVIGAAVYFWKKHRNQKRISVEVTILPHEAALSLLDMLADVENIDGKVFYFSLSNILRTYIQAIYNINALEMTTEELLPKVDLLNLNKEMHQGATVTVARRQWQWQRFRNQRTPQVWPKWLTASWTKVS